MKLSDDAIEKFRAIYKKQFGKEISVEEAKEHGSNLVGFFELLIKWDDEDRKQKEQQLT
jgi:hypothetical protein